MRLVLYSDYEATAFERLCLNATCADKIRRLQPSLANSMSFSWALCADKYTATLTSCAYCYLSTEEKEDTENGSKRCI